MSDRLSKDTKRGAALPRWTMKVAAAVLFCCAALLTFTGCEVTVAGKKRPLVRHEPLHGELEFVAEKQRNSQGASSSMRHSDTDIFKERIRLKTQGDVYHPDFIFFNVGAGIGLAQESINSDEENGRDNATLDEYNISAQILRRKAYPVMLHANKNEDLIARQFLGSLSTTQEGRGASISLNSRNWPMTLSYDTSKTSQDSFSTTTRDFFYRDDKRVKYTLQHRFSDRSKASLKIDRSDVSQRSIGTAFDTQTDRLTLLHDYIFGSNEQHRLDSSVNYVNQTGAFDYRNLRLDERMRLQHTANFSTNYEMRYNESERSQLKTKETRGRVGFEHKLYDSLITTGNLFGALTDLDNQGKLEQYGGGLGLSYRKKNRWGTLLSSYTWSAIDTRQSGGTGVGVVVGEAHTADDIIPIELDRTNIDVSTIVVRDELGQPYQSEDYIIEGPVNGKVRIRTITVGGAIPPNFVAGDKFYVDYNYYIEPSRREDTVRQNLTIRERFKNGFSTYYMHQRQRQTVSSSLTQITPDEFTGHIVGIDYTRGGFYFLAEYSKEDSTQIPSRGTRLESRYSWPLSTRTTATIRGTTQWLNFGQPDARDVTLYKAGAELFSRLTDKYELSSRLDYRNEDDTRFGRTRGFQMTSELRYRYRQLTFATGAELNFLTRRSDQVNSALVYVRVKRRF